MAEVGDAPPEVQADLDQYEPSDLLGLGADIQRNLSMGRTPEDVMSDLSRMGFRWSTARFLVQRAAGVDPTTGQIGDPPPQPIAPTPENPRPGLVTARPQPQNQNLAGCIGLAVVLGGGYFVMHSCSDLAHSVKPSRSESRSSAEMRDLGYVGTLDVGGGSIALGVTKGDYDELSDLMAAKDQTGVENMVLQQRAFLVDSGVRAKKIGWSWGVTRVRILSGDHAGDDGWIADEFLK